MVTFLSSATASVFPPGGSSGQFDGQTDVGSPKISGSASYDAVKQEYTLTGSGPNMWGSGDQFHFLWKRMKGDFILRARVEFIGKGMEPHRKVGWMARSSLDPGAPYVDCAEHGDGLTSLQYRQNRGADTAQIELPLAHADVIQFERKGNSCTGTPSLSENIRLTKWICCRLAPCDVTLCLEFRPA